VKALALAAAAIVTAASVSPAQAVTGQELLRQCEALERGALVSGETVQLPKSQDAATCWVYMGAVQDLTATVEEEGGPSLIGSCVPPETTRMELVRAQWRSRNSRTIDGGNFGAPPKPLFCQSYVPASSASAPPSSIADKGLPDPVVVAPRRASTMRELLARTSSRRWAQASRTPESSCRNEGLG